jgi:hypothetical protein
VRRRAARNGRLRATAVGGLQHAQSILSYAGKSGHMSRSKTSGLLLAQKSSLLWLAIRRFSGTNLVALLLAGVYWSTLQGGSWLAMITVEGQAMQLGLFPDEESAAVAWNMAALIIFKDEASLNILDTDEAAGRNLTANPLLRNEASPNSDGDGG